MVEKKAAKKVTKKAPEKKAAKAKATKAKATKAKTKNSIDDSSGDMGIVIVDDDIEIDQEKVNEERRAYLEESRSQEAFD